MRRWHSGNLPVYSGTFTPYITGCDAGIVNGNYERIGNMVHFRLYLSYIGATIPTNDGIVRGLPFVYIGGAVEYTTCSLYMSSATATLPTNITNYVETGQATICLVQNQTRYSVQSNQDIILSGSYRVAY
jgi:hypothetical protein